MPSLLPVSVVVVDDDVDAISSFAASLYTYVVIYIYIVYMEEKRASDIDE